jgi:Ca2+/H+ antiporter
VACNRPDFAVSVIVNSALEVALLLTPVLVFASLAGSQALVECFHPARDPIWWQLVSNRLPLVDCTIQLSEAPGLGWELDQEFVEVRVRA